MMDKFDLYKKLMNLVPCPKSKVEEFPLKLKERLSKFKAIVLDFDFVGLELERDSILSHIENLSIAITSAISKIYDGQPAEAYNVLQRESSSLSKLIVCYHRGESFYRMRVVAKDKRNIGAKDMFHIPYNKRDIVSTQRYSMPGYPCLYLGQHSYGCWEELGRPNLDSCMISRLENQNEIVVWDLRLPQKRHWNNAETIALNLKIFPLVIACMFKVNNSDANFKPEYSIPQLLLELIHNQIDIKGIAYTSVHKNREFKFPDEVFDNYVIPVRNTSTLDYCTELCSLFKITNPTCEEYERVKNGIYYQNFDSGEWDIEDDDWNRYKQSLFGVIDKKLMARGDYHLRTINPKISE